MNDDDSDKFNGLGESMNINIPLVLVVCAIAFVLAVLWVDKPHAESADVSAESVPICYIDVRRSSNVTERHEGELK